MSTETKRLKAKKDNGQTGEFTEFQWKLMGVDKNGWKLVDSATSSKKGAPLDIQKQQEYDALIARSEGFEKDGAIREALPLFIQASEIKKTRGVTGKIKKYTETLEKYDKTFALAQAAEGEDKVAEALELYTAANVLLPSEALKAKIADLELI